VSAPGTTAAGVGTLPTRETRSSPAWFQEHFEDAAGQVLEFFADDGADLAGKDVADIGAGDGIIDLGVFTKASPARLVGFDIVPTDRDRLLELARRDAGIEELPDALEFRTSLPTSLPADDASFDKEGSPETVAAVFGYAVGVLGVPSAAPWTLLPDAVNTATVMLANGTLAGDTLDNVKGGSNWFLWGDEIIGAETVVQNMDGSWTLSNLLRGLRGTEWAAGYWGDFSNGVNTHVSGELVVQISAPGIPRGGATGVVRYQDSATILGKLLYYRGVTLGQDITTADDQDFTITGADLKPYSPIKVGGAFNSFNDLVITWQRRTRIGGDEWGNELGSSFPISEESELYDVEILNAGGTAVVRTISNLTTPLAVYLEANQVTDFGSVQSSYKVNVYQKSATVGRGFKGHGVSPASNGITPVYPGSGQFYVNGT